MSVRVLESIKEIPAEIWDTLWSDYPFTRHAFLLALEESGATQKESGWQVRHLVYQHQNEVLAALPLYLKTHSWGEYVFDWAWADAYQQHGLAYYPKLLAAIPFTPATGPRIGIKPGTENSITIIQSFLEFCLQAENWQGCSSFHLLFPENQLVIKHEALVERLGYQFQWFNQGFRDFDDFLEIFSSRKRKNIKKERARSQAHSLEFQHQKGSELSEEEWQQFYIFYHTTYLKRSGRYGYLDKTFFSQLGRTLGDAIYVVSARKNNKLIAMSLFFEDQQTLYGRYWGCAEELDCLHFELCYYQGIDYAIKQGLKRFDSGAQGEHKIQRGFTPVYTRSYHYLHHPEFQRAITRFCSQEKVQLEYYLAEARKALPFKDNIECVNARCLL